MGGRDLARKEVVTDRIAIDLLSPLDATANPTGHARLRSFSRSLKAELRSLRPAGVQEIATRHLGEIQPEPASKPAVVKTDPVV